MSSATLHDTPLNGTPKLRESDRRRWEALRAARASLTGVRARVHWTVDHWRALPVVLGALGVCLLAGRYLGAVPGVGLALITGAAALRLEVWRYDRWEDEDEDLDDEPSGGALSGYRR